MRLLWSLDRRVPGPWQPSARAKSRRIDERATGAVWTGRRNFFRSLFSGTGKIYIGKHVFTAGHPERPRCNREFLYCAPLGIRRKTPERMGKTVILPPLSPARLSKPKNWQTGFSGGRNGDRFYDERRAQRDCGRWHRRLCVAARTHSAPSFLKLVARASAS